MDEPLYFITTLRPRRPDFLATMTPEEKAVMGEHAAYTRRLFDEGRIILGGAATDGAIGVIVWRLESAEEARRIFENDPAVRAGIGDAELHPFRIGLLAGKA
ncbi:MAG: YciI family protein [Methanomicrobiales archaeon]|nr:YciI family protein [Methanomicrobiales archaeon]